MLSHSASRWLDVAPRSSRERGIFRQRGGVSRAIESVSGIRQRDSQLTLTFVISTRVLWFNNGEKFRESPFRLSLSESTYTSCVRRVILNLFGLNKIFEIVIEVNTSHNIHRSYKHIDMRLPALVKKPA